MESATVEKYELKALEIAVGSLFKILSIRIQLIELALDLLLIREFISAHRLWVI